MRDAIDGGLELYPICLAPGASGQQRGNFQGNLTLLVGRDHQQLYHRYGRRNTGHRRLMTDIRGPIGIGIELRTDPAEASAGEFVQ